MQTCPEHRLVLVNWSSFLVWNHWAMFMNGSWWRHQLEYFSASLAFCAFRAGHTLVTGEFPHKGQWRGTLIFSLICVRINGLVKKHKAADLGHHRAHYCPACLTSLIATRFLMVMICPIIKCLTVLEFSFLLFDLCLFITIFNFILNYVPIVTFWIFTYHQIWILLIIFCVIWSYWIIYF